MMRLQFSVGFGDGFVLFFDGLIGHDYFHFELLIDSFLCLQFFFGSLQIMLYFIVGEVECFKFAVDFYIILFNFFQLNY